MKIGVGRLGLLLLVALAVAVLLSRSGCGRTSTPQALGQPTPTPSIVAPTTVVASPTLTPPPTPKPPSPTPTLTPTVTPTPTPVASVRLREAEGHQRNGDYARAAEGYEALLSSSPGTPEARKALLLLGETYLLDKNYQAALQAFQRFLREYPGDEARGRATFQMASAYKGLGDLSRALEHFREYASFKGNIGGYVSFQMAEIYTQAGDRQKAIEELARVLEADTPLLRTQAMQRIASHYHILKEYEKAIEWYNQLLARASSARERAPVLYQIAEAREGQGKGEEARALFLEIVRSYPQTDQAEPALERMLKAEPGAVDQFQRGLVYYYAGRYEEAIASFLQFIAAPSQVGLLPRGLYYAGLSYARRGDLPQALDILGRLVNSHPQDALADDALWERGRLLENALRHGEAALEYHRLAESYPGGNLAAKALFREGLSRYKEADYDSALAAWQRLLQSYAGSEEESKTLFWTGKLLGARGKEAEARTLLERAMQKGSKDYYALRARPLYEGQPHPLAKANTYRADSLSLPRDEEREKRDFEDWLASWASFSPGGYAPERLDPRVVQDPAFRRGEELLSVGLRREAIAEFRGIIAKFSAEPALLYSLALFFKDRGLYSLSISAASSLSALSPTPSFAGEPRFLKRLMYPAYFLDLVVAEAAKENLDPLVFLALIRQESLFDAGARSVSDARGLTQVIPPTGKGIAERLARANFHPDDLFKPYVSVEFGAWYLAAQMEYFRGDAVLALAAYNGGPGNAQRWLRGNASRDPDLFLEDISLSEPETYVKRIYEHYLRYLETYSPG